MPAEQLHAPWRIDYIRSLEKPDDGKGGCFLCAAAEAAGSDERRHRLVLWSTDHSICLINRFPYANGHLMVAPRNHKHELDILDDAELIDLQRQTVEAMKLLRRAISPQGFNIGINLGHCAGAGLPGHVHQHIVPRWAGDTNFISVVGGVRIVPQAIEALYDELAMLIRDK